MIYFFTLEYATNANYILAESFVFGNHGNFVQVLAIIFIMYTFKTINLMT